MMKQHLLSISILILILAGCTSKNEYSRLLVQADALMLSQPDSALYLLQEIAPRQFPNKADRAYYALLLTQAEYKNYIKLTSDSLIQNAVSYYGQTKNRLMQAKAYYYQGCTFSDMNECDKATKAYHNAIHAANRIKAGNSRLSGLIYNSMAHVYQNQGLTAKADSMYQLTEELAIRIKDTILLGEALSRRGIYSISLGKEHYRQAEKQMLKAYRLSKKIKLLPVQGIAAASLSNLYSRMQDHAQALFFAKEFLSLSKKDSTELARACLLLGDSYYKAGQYDSANIYLHRSLSTNEYEIKEKACMSLSGIARMQKSFEQALKWEEARSSYREMWFQSQQKTKTAVIKKNMEQEEADKEQCDIPYIYYVCSFIGIIAVIVTYVFFIRGYPKGHRIPLRPRNKIGEHFQKVLRIEKFKEEINGKAYRIKMDNIIKYHETHAGYLEHFDESDKLKFLHDVNTLLGDYTGRLKKKYPLLNEKDVFFCSLCLLDMSDKQIAIILERDRTSVFRKRKSIFERKMNAKGKSIEETLKRV